MESGYIWLILAQLIIILIIFIVKYILYLVETNKINKIIKYMENRAKDKEFKAKFKECLDIIEKFKGESENG